MAERTPQEVAKILEALAALHRDICEARTEISLAVHEAFARTQMKVSAIEPWLGQTNRSYRSNSSRHIHFAKPEGYYVGVEYRTTEGPVTRKTGFYG